VSWWGAARAISVAAGKELDDECNEYLWQFGSIRVGRPMHTSAGKFWSRIKHVIHVVGPEAHETSNRQVNFGLVQRMVVCSIEHAERVLNAASIAVPAISAGFFGVPKIAVAQELYQAILKFNETEPRFVKTVQLVNLDKGVTDLINEEFAWWFGGLAVRPECVSTECRATILPRFIGQGQVTNKIDLLEAPRGDVTLLVKRTRKKKKYIPEKFTYFWLGDSPFSQHFKCEFFIDGRLYNCTEQWMM